IKKASRGPRSRTTLLWYTAPSLGMRQNTLREGSSWHPSTSQTMIAPGAVRSGPLDSSPLRTTRLGRSLRRPGR
ncbi:Ribosomal large subunit pseudouridine synthase C, partial [Durusdinium trenchii]